MHNVIEAKIPRLVNANKQMFIELQQTDYRPLPINSGMLKINSWKMRKGKERLYICGYLLFKVI
jgi:hypothetical protein